PGAGVHHSYQQNPWGGNITLFVDPTETRSARTYWDKGAAQFPNSFPLPDETTDWVAGGALDIGGFKTGTGRVDLTDGTSAHTYSYGYTDLTRAYNTSARHDSENAIKATNNERHWVRFPATTPGTTPGYLVIYDRLGSVSTTIEKRWLIHPPGHSTPTTRTMTISNYDSLVTNGT